MLIILLLSSSFFKVFTELVTILLLFYCFVFWHVILVPWLGIELASPALKGEVLTTGLPPGKSTLLFFNYIMEDSYRIPCLRSRALGTTMQNFTSFGEQLELINRIWSFQQYLQCCLKNTIAEYYLNFSIYLIQVNTLIPIVFFYQFK